MLRKHWGGGGELPKSVHHNNIKTFEYENMDILLWHNVAFRLQGASPERPCVGRNDIRIYRQGRKGVEEPGEGDADADHWSYMVERGSGRNHQSATRVQQLLGLVPLHRGVCCTGIWLLSRDRPTGG